MELLILILIILVVMAFSLSCISFWMTIKMVREISRLEENVKNSTDKINSICIAHFKQSSLTSNFLSSA